MSLLVYIPLMCSGLLAACAPQIGRRAAPRSGAGALVASSVLVAVAADITLGVLVGARLLDAAPLATLLGWRAETSAPIGVPVPISLAAGLGLLGVAVLAVLAGAHWRRSRAIRARLLAMHAGLPGGELIVMQAEQAVAHALPGRRGQPGRILVSEAMLRALGPGERRVLLAHERCHLRHHHHRYRALVRLASTVNPMLRPTIEATDLLLERWADEEAARVVGSRRLTAKALARAAVLDAGRGRFALPGFATHRVSYRVSALLDVGASGGARLRMLLLLLAIGLSAVFSAGAAAHQLAHLFDILRGDG